MFLEDEPGRTKMNIIGSSPGHCPHARFISVPITEPNVLRVPQLAFRFGAISDVQFSDVEDGWNFWRTQRRRYRGTLESLRHAVSDWSSQGRNIAFVADLGDIIDQQCETNGNSCEALARVLSEWELLEVPIVRLVGNHELYNFNRAQCAELIPGITPFYHSFRPHQGWRMIVLDAYDLNMIERGGGTSAEEGISFLQEHNPNDLRAPRGSGDVTAGLQGLQRRYVPMAGAVRKEQLQWLVRELQDAQRESEHVIVLTHVPIAPGATVASALLWNYDDVIATFHEVDVGTVVMVLAGHYHSGGYCRDDRTGTHHVTLQSPLHTTESEPLAHCTVEVWHDRIEILGHGIVPSRCLPLHRQSSDAPNTVFNIQR